MRKYSKVIVYSILSWSLYYLFDYFKIEKFLLNSHERMPYSTDYHTTWYLAYYLLLSIFKYFLLLFGIGSLIFLAYKLYKSNND